MKTKQVNDLTDHVGAFYTENDIELSWSIESGTVSDENHRGQRLDW